MKSDTDLEMKLITVLLIASACATTSTLALRKSKCPAERDLEMDVCAAKLGFLGDHSFTVPKNLTAMEPFCTNLKQSIGCLQAYSRDCLQGFTRQILTNVLRRGKQQHSSICASDESKRNFMARMSCLADDKIEPFHQCMDASVVRFEHISAKVRHDNKLPGLCCSYQIFNREIDTTLNKICGKPPATASRKNSINEFIGRIVGSTAGELFAIICDGHRSLEDCQRSPKTSTVLPELEELTVRVGQGKLKPKHKSFLPILLDILDSNPSSR